MSAVDRLRNPVQEQILEYARSIMSSPWVYLIVAAVACLDSFLPILPSEAVMITGGVFAASTGRPELLLLIASGAAGAFLGDHVGYGIGRSLTGPVMRWFHRTEGRTRRLDWAQRNISRRGGLILIVARYIPGGRTLTTVTMGVVKYPIHRFTGFDVIAVCSWATYGSMIGYLGGHLFEDNPLLGLLVGLGIAVTIAVLIEIVRRISARGDRSEQAGTR